MDEDDILNGSSVVGSSEFSSTLVTDEEFGVYRAPAIVARLMGLDSSAMHYNHSITSFDTQSLQDLHIQSQNLETQQDHHLISLGDLHEKMEAPIRNALEPKHQRTSNRPFQKLHTAVLLPKSAKSIPITHRKLLSPKRANCSPSNNDARIKETAAWIIDSEPQGITKAKIPVIDASSFPLKARDTKQKVEGSQKNCKFVEASCQPHQSSSLKCFKGESISKSWKGSADTASVKRLIDSGECSVNSKRKGKSVSLALQAKANVQKREGLSLNGKKAIPKQQNEVISSVLCEGRDVMPKGSKKKPSIGSSNVLQPNNQEQNGFDDRGSIPSEQTIPNSNGSKPVNRDTSVGRYTCPTISTRNKVIRRSSYGVKYVRNEDTHSSTRTTSHEKRYKGRNFHVDQAVNDDKLLSNKDEKPVQSQPNVRKGADGVSFTFTSRMTRSNHGPESCREVQDKKIGFSADLRDRQLFPNKDDVNNQKASLRECNGVGYDELNILLEEKSRQSTYGLVNSINERVKGETSPSSSHISPPVVDAFSTMTSSHEQNTKGSRQADEVGTCSDTAVSSADFRSFIPGTKIQVIKKYEKNDIEGREVLDSRIASPVCVLEHSFLSESCNSSDTADSSVSGDGRQSSFVQAQEVLGIHPSKQSSWQAGLEFSDTASSSFAPRFSSTHGLLSSLSDPPSPILSELDYVKKIVRDIDLMFEYFASGKTSRTISPHLFLHLEIQNSISKRHLLLPRGKLPFDCVAECLNKRFQQHDGGYKAWVEGVFLMSPKERLAEDVFKEISTLCSMGDYMVDELVDKDMSNKYGRWLDFNTETFELGIQIENCILNTFLNEVIVDML